MESVPENREAAGCSALNHLSAPLLRPSGTFVTPSHTGRTLYYAATLETL